MQLGVFSGVTTDDDYGFSDEETVEVSLVEDMEQISPEEELESSRESRVLEL